jgi:nitrite reductase/ring-hydroxylating ferredoxin subunit/DMSO/TMAO reductase YedYZ heme-binding membrane subunit
MGASYQAVLWNRHKKIYDLALLGLCAIYLSLFILLTWYFHPQVPPPTLIVRATGSLAILLLHVVLAIGPLSRLDRRFLPLLYNRRHLGVTMFIIALIHGAFSILQFHGFGDINPLVSVLISNTHYGSVMRFPFQPLGLVALIILFLMAASSHDFWLHHLGARVWKGLHMMAYLAYALIVMHVMLGVVQLEDSPWLIGLLGVGVINIICLHLVSGYMSYQKDRYHKEIVTNGYIKTCSVDDILENQAKLVVVEGKSIAIFKYDGKLSAVDNACKHQNGPLSEGRIVDGCITCPWHGYQYIPESGKSPPPFEEKISTYELKLSGQDILVDPVPKPPGTEVTPCSIKLESDE